MITTSFPFDYLKNCMTCTIPLSLTYKSPHDGPIPEPHEVDANGHWKQMPWYNANVTEIYHNVTSTGSSRQIEYIYTTWEGMKYKLIKTTDWDIESNTSVTKFEATAVSVWYYYMCHFELRWNNGSTYPGGINPRNYPTPSVPYINDPTCGYIEGETLIGTYSNQGPVGTMSPSSTLSYGYTGHGDYTALFANNSFIEYRYTCGDPGIIEFWVGDTASHRSENKMYYTDPDGTAHLLVTLPPYTTNYEPVESIIITASFPFDYKRSCVGK